MILNHSGGQRPQIHADFLYASHSGKMYSDLMGRDAPSARADDRGAMLRSRARCLQVQQFRAPLRATEPLRMQVFLLSGGMTWTRI